MKQQILCAALAATLTLAPSAAFAAEETVHTPVVTSQITDISTAVMTAPLPFTDVKENQWFYSYVEVCYNEKLVSGVSQTEFSPTSILNEAQCATFCARILAAQRGETLDESYDKTKGETWYTPILRYLEEYDLQVVPGVQCTRARFLSMLGKVVSDESLTPLYEVTSLPDSEDENVMKFYRAGILNGMDKYGTFAPSRTLTRAEAATMIARILRPELRVVTDLADYSPFLAAGVSHDTVFFTSANGSVTAADYLTVVNHLIASLEDACTAAGMEFNWLNTYGEQTFLDYVTETAMSELGVAKNQATQTYGVFNLQVYYSRLIDRRGGVPLSNLSDFAPATQSATTEPQG